MANDKLVNIGGLWLSKAYQKMLEDKDIANLPALIGKVNGVSVVCFANKYKTSVMDSKPFYVVYENVPMDGKGSQQEKTPQQEAQSETIPF